MRNQLTVEITANETTARLLGWVLKQHTIIAFALYTAGLTWGRIFPWIFKCGKMLAVT